MTRYMVIETFLPGCKDALYARFHDKGRMLPDGLFYLDSWLTANGKTCFQLMETSDVSLFCSWIEHWKDLCAFEIVELGSKPEQSDV